MARQAYLAVHLKDIRKLLPTLPMWIMLAAIASLVTVGMTPVGENPNKGGILLLRGCGFQAVDHGVCTEEQYMTYAASLMIMLILALLVLPVLYAWNGLLVRVGIGDDW